MKAKNILMSILLVMGSIAAKAAGYPPELALVSQPVMVYNYSSITVSYDVENIGDYTYRGYISLYLYPDDGYSYAEEYVKVRPGRIKRVSIDIPLRRIDRRHTFTIMPYYELDDELYSFTTFEYFEPISFFWNGPRTERWVVITIPPRIRFYHRPGTYRFYYDGYRPPMPPPGHGPGTPPPPMNPKHHTYGYHHNNGGYPATHPEVNNPPANGNHDVAPSATVRPKANGGSMSSGSSNSGGSNTPAPTPNNGGSSSGRTSSSNSSGRVSSSSGRTDNPTSTRPATNSSSYSRPSGNSNSSSSRVNSGSSSRPSSGTSNSSSSRASSSSSNSRSSGTSTSSSSRSNSGSSRTSSSSNSSRSSGTSNSSSRSSSSSRGGSSSGRR